MSHVQQYNLHRLSAEELSTWRKLFWSSQKNHVLSGVVNCVQSQCLTIEAKMFDPEHSSSPLWRLISPDYKVTSSGTKLTCALASCDLAGKLTCSGCQVILASYWLIETNAVFWLVRRLDTAAKIIKRQTGPATDHSVARSRLWPTLLLVDTWWPRVTLDPGRSSSRSLQSREVPGSTQPRCVWDVMLRWPWLVPGVAPAPGQCVVTSARPFLYTRQSARSSHRPASSPPRSRGRMVRPWSMTWR